MKIGVQSLETVNQLANQGAESAATALAERTPGTPTVETTKTRLVAKTELGDDFGGRQLVGVRMGLDGGLTGQIALVFEKQDAATFLTASADNGGTTTIEQSQLRELGTILIKGFLDGWATHLKSAINFTSTSLIEGTGGSILEHQATSWDTHDQVFAISSELEAGLDPVTAYLFMFPTYESFETVISAWKTESATPIPFEKLSTFNRMARTGADKASASLTAMTGMESSVELSQLCFIPIESLPQELEDQRYIGTRFRLDGLPSGEFVILFDEESGHTVADRLIPMKSDEFSEMHRSAIEEVGNILTSGFIDGWANVLGTTIEHSPPEFVYDKGAAILTPIANRVSKSQDFAFIIDSALYTTDGAVNCDVFAIPNEDELRRTLMTLDRSPSPQ